MRHVYIVIEDWGPVPRNNRPHVGIVVQVRDAARKMVSVDIGTVSKATGDEFRRRLWERLGEPRA